MEWAINFNGLDYSQIKKQMSLTDMSWVKEADNVEICFATTEADNADWWQQT